MSPEKPNVGKPVQLYEGFLIKQYHSTIWVPKLAYPTENFFSSYTSQFERNLLAETPENPFGSSSSQNCSATPAFAQIGLRQPHSISRWPCVSFSRFASAPGGPASNLGASTSAALANLVLCATLGCLCVALCEPFLALRHPPWLLRCSPGSISAFFVSLYSMPLSCSPDHRFYLS